MEVVRAEHGGDIGSGLRRHGFTEDLRLGRVGLQVRPEPLGRHLLQRRGTGAQRMLQVAVNSGRAIIWAKARIDCG